MLCHALSNTLHTFRLSERRPTGTVSVDLLHGSNMTEPRFVNDLLDWQLAAIHAGKDDSINHMLAGGNGFVPSRYSTIMAQNAHDAGCTIERRDKRSMHEWAIDYASCRRDRARGRTDG